MARQAKRPAHARPAEERSRRKSSSKTHPAHARPADARPLGDDATRERTSEIRNAPARIALLYESRDGKLCLFEDHEGHLTAVRSERLA